MTGWRGRIATRLFLVLLTPLTFGKSSADVLNTDFVTELYRAANEVGKLTAFEKRRLIERAVTTVKQMRVQIAFSSPPRRDGQDILVDIATVGGEIVSAPNQIVSHALLEAADLIRTLKIVLDGKCARGMDTC
ncbi:hypothetical protein [Rhizobium laguerreae]|uniref:hypothetical protein n=1 Tax=Rhizobium laguerreae TaxID=1076926 RepID=UPI001C8FFCDC|nr:hypothetical protein [Rhizobium laguerreae]MBY3346468.1 hypothetical protein [Rhizobium laguerreae]MBY3353429.1 hypothetical protein [Rhizobium laguerreae]MBY3374475.1 hypothetical protein [Rhizobium laguerreae]MBY3429705.1 hypothetical protein [Rhizobium laguerreae]MBY3438353.1 hypothetical protein [Rhizobium laguerreae]